MTRKTIHILITSFFAFLTMAFICTGLSSRASADTGQSAIRSMEYYPASTEMSIPRFFAEEWDYYRLHSIFDPNPYIKSDQNDIDMQSREVQNTLHDGDRMTITYDNGEEKTYHAKTFIDTRNSGAGSGEDRYGIVWYDEDENTTGITTDFRSDEFFFIMSDDNRTAGIKDGLVSVDVEEPYRGNTSFSYEMKFNVTGRSDVTDKKLKKLKKKDIQLTMNNYYTSRLLVRSRALKSKQILKLNVRSLGPTKYTSDYSGKKLNLRVKQGSVLDLTLRRSVFHKQKEYYSFSKPTTIHCLFDRPKKAALSSGNKKLKVSWGRVSKASGYEIKYSNKKNMKKARTIKIKGGKKNEMTIRKLARNKKYYVRIRPYRIFKNKTYTGFYSDKLSVKTNTNSTTSYSEKVSK